MLNLISQTINNSWRYSKRKFTKGTFFENNDTSFSKLNFYVSVLRHQWLSLFCHRKTSHHKSWFGQKGTYYYVTSLTAWFTRAPSFLWTLKLTRFAPNVLPNALVIIFFIQFISPLGIIPMEGRRKKSYWFIINIFLLAIFIFDLIMTGSNVGRSSVLQQFSDFFSFFFLMYFKNVLALNFYTVALSLPWH